MVGEVDIEALLDCIWAKESGKGKNMLGDGGRAFGHYQIHLAIHPVTYACAMDYECSRTYTKLMILQGKGYLWTSFTPCKKIM